MIPDGLSDRATPRYLDGMFGRWSVTAHTAKTKGFEDAHTTARNAWTSIHRRNKSLAGDPTKNEASRLLSSAVHAKKQLGAAQARFDAAKASADERRAQIAERFDQATRPPTDVGKSLLQQELRAHLKAMKPSDRSTFVNAAITSCNLEILDAVVRAPAMLTGIGDTLHDMARSAFLSVHRTEETIELANLDKAEATARHGLNALREHAAHEIDFRKADEIAGLVAQEDQDEAA